jgi:hypothetical protein
MKVGFQEDELAIGIPRVNRRDRFVSGGMPSNVSKRTHHSNANRSIPISVRGHEGRRHLDFGYGSRGFAESERQCA